MIDFTTANNALKTVYLGVVSDILNLKTNPLYAKIKQSTKGVYGKEIKVLAPMGVNGGICATSETGSLPKTSDGNYVNLTSTLKNLYGVIEISDKAVRASQSSSGAFVNLLNDEMERLIEASAYNLSRMLYGNGTGLLTEIKGISTDKKTLTVEKIAPFIEGMVIDIYDQATEALDSNGIGFRVVSVDRASKKVTLDKQVTISEVEKGGYHFVVQSSLNNEITGIEALFDNNVTTLYGLAKATYPLVKGYVKANFGAMSEVGVIAEMDNVESISGGTPNFITASTKARRKLQGVFITAKKPIQTMVVEGGFKAIDFYGVPFISDKFIDDDLMYLLNTDNFIMHQLCDWEWMSDEGGNVLTQKTGYAAYSATLVKYADLICNTPNAQCKVQGISIT